MTIFYKNTNSQVVPGVYVSELTHALDDSIMFFEGPPKNQQEIFEKLSEASKVVSQLRAMGYNCEIVRTYSEGAINHQTGNTIDVAPISRSYSDCYEMAHDIERMCSCSQIWIEASDDMGNFHVHYTYSPGNTKPDKKTILDIDASNVKEGFAPENETKLTEINEV